jgi:FkbM family methyltransferase
LRRNYAEQIAAGTVTLIEKGVWSEEAEIRFERDVHDSARHTFHHQPDADVEIMSIPVVPLDQIVSELALERIDFIKMDIEGAEREAIEGAQETLKRFRPEMAICTYHLDDDPEAVRDAVARTRDPLRDSCSTPRCESRPGSTQGSLFRGVIEGVVAGRIEQALFMPLPTVDGDFADHDAPKPRTEHS